MTLIQKLYDHLQTHQTLQAATVEAVHRFYYDQCFDAKTGRPFDTEEEKVVNMVLANLHCALPDWRYVITRNMERYRACSEPTNALSIYCRPVGIVSLKSSYLIK